MRIARARINNAERWGTIEQDGFVPRGASPFTPAFMDSDEASVPLAEVELLVPTVPSKIFCVGRNYSEHVAEMGYIPAGAPSVFLKPPTALLAHGGVVRLPPTSLSQHVEHEAEVAVVIGRPARKVTEADALAYVLGFTAANDVSARDLQRSDPQLTRGKGFDTFCPLGPWIETAVDLECGVRITSSVNGELRQDGNTRQMLYSIPYLISFLSQFSTLLPGDIVLTGSPGGSGPLRDGDEYEQTVEGIGTLRHRVAAAPNPCS